MLTRTNVTDKVTLSVTLATPGIVGHVWSIVGGGADVVFSNEKARLWVMCAMYLIRLMKEYILYIYTVVYSTGTRLRADVRSFSD